MKECYILEVRRRKRKDRYEPNEVIKNLGIFSTAKKAKAWIKTEGPIYEVSCKKDYFYMISVATIDDSEPSEYYGFYNLQGGEK
jgi:hypothetical protein